MITKSAPSSAARWFMCVSTVAAAPRVATILRATSALSSSRRASMSISAIVAPDNAGLCSTSPTMFFMNTVDPAPMKAILVISQLRE